MTTYETNGSMNGKPNDAVIYDDDEIDNSSETSKDYASSNSSSVEDMKKRDSLTSVEDNKEEKSKRSKRHSFTRMFKKDEKDDKEKPQSEGLVRSLSGLFGSSGSKDNKRNHTSDNEKFLRPTSRTSTNSGKSGKSKIRPHSFIFSSDNEDADADLKKGKSRRNSSSDVEKEKDRKKGNRLSKFLGLDESKPSRKPNIWDDTFIEPDEITLMSPKSPNRNSFPNGGTPASLKNRKISNIMNDSNIVDSPIDSRGFHLPTSTGTDDLNKLNGGPVSKSDNDDRSINSSSTLPSSVNDQDEIPSYKNNDHNDVIQRIIESNEKNESHTSKDDEQSSPTTPMTPKLVVTHSDLNPVQHRKYVESESNNTNVQKQVVFEEVQEQANVNGITQAKVIAESKPEVDRMVRINEIKSTMNVKPLIINGVDNQIHANPIIPDEREIKSINNQTTNTVEKQKQQQNNIVTTQIVDKDLGEKKQSKKPFSFSNLFHDDKRKTTREINSSNTTDEQTLKRELEETNNSLNDAKTSLEAKVVEQNGKLNSMEQIMQQQIDVTNRMTEMMQRLESKVNSQKEDAHDSKTLEDTIKRLEDKIDQQNLELNYLKSVVGQLTGSPLLLTDGEGSRAITYQLINRNENQNLITANQSQQTFSRPTLVSTLVVNPLYNTITVSASVATSVLYAVYVRPLVGLVKVVKNGM